MLVKIPNLPEWTEKKPLLPIASFLVQILTSGPLNDYLKDPNAYYKKYNFNYFPPIDTWLRFYTKKNIEIIWLENFLSNELKDPLIKKFLIVVLDYFQERIKYIKNGPNILAPWVGEVEFFKIVEWVENFNIPEMEAKIEKLSDIKIEEKLDKSPISIFFRRVYMPCFYIYGKNPQILFKKAINGNISALCDLLRVDKSIFRNKHIAETLQKISSDTDSKQFNLVSRAFNSSIKINSKKKIKETVAIIISASSQIYGQKLTSTQIQGLLDYVDSIIDPNQDTEGSTIKSTEALAKHIQRKTPLYRHYSELDKN